MVGVPFLKILSSVVNGCDKLVDRSGALGVRKMAFLFFDDAAKSTHGGDVDATEMWMISK